MLKSRLNQNLVSKFKTIFRFENQDVNWSINDLNLYSDAFARGLQNNGIGANGKVLFWLDENHTTEYVTSLYGTYKAGAQSRAVSALLKGKDMASPRILREMIEAENPSALLISPNQKVGMASKSEILLNAFPEAADAGTTGFMDVKSAPNLKFIIQTGFYAKPGFVKFRDFMVYPTKNYTPNLNFDIFKGIENIEAKSKLPSGDINAQDIVFVLSGFDDHDQVLRVILESCATGNLVEFISAQTLQKSDFVFAKDLDQSVRAHVIGSPEAVSIARQKFNRDNVNLISA